MSDFNLGTVTAYGYAKDKGYTGTEDEYAELMASYADVAEQAAESATQAAASATTATAKASEAAQSATAAASSKTAAETAQGGAETAAQTATTKAGEASTAATTATNKATEATTAATTATGKATEAAGSATTATTKAGEASASATNAAASATRAQEILDSIPEDYSQLSDDVSDLKDGLTAVESDVTDLKEDYTTILGSAYVTDTASGAIASFPDGADGVPVKSLMVDIEPVQSGSGDPSPSNVRPISGHTSAVVTRCGKNLVDISQFATQYPDYCSYADGVLSVTAASVLYSTGISVFIPSGSAINWSITNGTATNAKMRFVFADGTVANVTNPIPYTTVKDVVALRFDWSTAGTFTVSNFQAEIGSTATAYEPYQGQTVTIDLDGTRYGGSLDVTTGVLTVDMAIADMGTLVWGYNSTYSFMYSPSLSGKKVGSVNVLCENYKTLSTPVSSDSQMGSKENNTVSVGAANVVVFVKDTSFTDAASFKTAMNGVQLCYELAEPFTVQLTAQDDITTLKGQNNIWANCGDTEVEYRADTKLYIEKLTAPTEDDMIADHAISSGSFFMVGNTLYRATTAIASGATITVGTNATKLSLSDALNALA